MGLDNNAIRNRLIELKTKSGLDNYEFCNIYAPERCTASKPTVVNYMSAVFSGRSYPKEKNGPAKIELEHLQNLIDCGKFEGLTMNYLLYGDELPQREKKVVDLNIHNWTLADFCELILAMLQAYPYAIKYNLSELDKYSISFGDGIDTTENHYYFSLKFLEMDTLDDAGCDLGLGLQTFFEELEKCQKISSSKAREIAIKELVKTIRSDDRYNKVPLDKCQGDSGFITLSYDGPQVKGLTFD